MKQRSCRKSYCYSDLSAKCFSVGSEFEWSVHLQFSTHPSFPLAADWLLFVLTVSQALRDTLRQKDEREPYHQVSAVSICTTLCDVPECQMSLSGIFATFHVCFALKDTLTVSRFYVILSYSVSSKSVTVSGHRLTDRIAVSAGHKNRVISAWNTQFRSSLWPFRNCTVAYFMAFFFPLYASWFSFLFFFFCFSKEAWRSFVVSLRL